MRPAAACVIATSRTRRLSMAGPAPDPSPGDIGFVVSDLDDRSTRLGVKSTWFGRGEWFFGKFWVGSFCL